MAIEEVLNLLWGSNIGVTSFTGCINNLNMDNTILLLLGVLVIWELIWKGIALWKAGRNDQWWWFVAILLLNTLGLLPIIYISFFQHETEEFSVSITGRHISKTKPTALPKPWYHEKYTRFISRFLRNKEAKRKFKDRHERFSVAAKIWKKK